MRLVDKTCVRGRASEGNTGIMKGRQKHLYDSHPSSQGLRRSLCQQRQSLLHKCKIRLFVIPPRGLSSTAKKGERLLTTDADFERLVSRKGDGHAKASGTIPAVQEASIAYMAASKDG